MAAREHNVSSFQQDLSEEGLDRIRLQNRCLELCILPQAGGKIIDLIDRGTGRNWLWHNPRIAPVAGSRSDDFGCRQDTGGWDEVLLSVKPGTVELANGHSWQVPDHGDVIGRQWQVEDLQADPHGDVICSMSVAGSDVPYELKRSIRLLHDQPKVEATYFVSNQGQAPMPCYWCAHSLFAIETGAEIRLSGKPPMRVEDAATREQADCNRTQYWPTLQLRDGTSRDLSRSFADNGPGPEFASKVFVAADRCGAIQLRMPGGDERLSMSFDPSELPWLGLWINNRGWSGCGTEPYLNLGIEPATSPYDWVGEAIQNDAVDWLQPGEVRTWSLLVELAS